LILAGVANAFFLGVLGCWVLQRYAHVDFKSSWFAAAIGGASEMTTQSERYGAQSDCVATVHSLRVLLVVVIVPFVFQWWLGVQVGPRTYMPLRAVMANPGAVCLFIGCSCLLVWLFKKLHVPSAWVLGPMAFTILLSSQEIHIFSSMPQSVSIVGQLM